MYFFTLQNYPIVVKAKSLVDLPLYRWSLVNVGLAAPPAEGAGVEGRHIPVGGKCSDGPVKFRGGNLRTRRRITALNKLLVLEMFIHFWMF
jgi:hypothetical protein